MGRGVFCVTLGEEPTYATAYLYRVVVAALQLVGILEPTERNMQSAAVEARERVGAIDIESALINQGLHVEVRDSASFPEFTLAAVATTPPPSPPRAPPSSGNSYVAQMVFEFCYHRDFYTDSTWALTGESFHDLHSQQAYVALRDLCPTG